MHSFKIIKTLSQNKVNVGDEFIIDFKKRVVTSISKARVMFDDGSIHNLKMINSWIRLEKNNLKHKHRVDQRVNNFKKFVDDWRQNQEVYQETPVITFSYILYENNETKELKFIFSTQSKITDVDLISRLKFPKTIHDAGSYITNKYMNSNKQFVTTLYPYNTGINPIRNKALEEWKEQHPLYELIVHKNFQTIRKKK